MTVRARHVALALIASVSLPLWSKRARAVEPAGAVAEALFREGRQRMAEGNYKEACPKLLESQRIDPHIGTLLNLAFCHTKEGRTATAWGEYAQAAAEAQRAGRKDNEASAREQMATLEGQLTRLVIVATATPLGLAVTLDGASLGAGALGSPLPVDPGSHEVVASAPSRVSARLSVEAAAGPGTVTLQIPSLAVAPATGSSGADVAGARPGSDAPARPASSLLGPLVLAGAGVIAVGVGTYFGIAAFNSNAQASRGCTPGCDMQAIDSTSDARHSATASTVAFIVAGVAGASSVAWWLVDRRDRPSIHVAASRSSVELEGRF